MVGPVVGLSASDSVIQAKTSARLLRYRSAAVLLQTIGIMLGVFVLWWLVGGVAGLWLMQSLLWYVAVGSLLRLAWKVLHWVTIADGVHHSYMCKRG